MIQKIYLNNKKFLKEIKDINDYLKNLLKKASIDEKKDTFKPKEFSDFLNYLDLNIPNKDIIVDDFHTTTLYLHYKELFGDHRKNPSVLKLFIHGQTLPKIDISNKDYIYSLVLFIYLEIIYK